ncbi:MAG: hypothetical protein DWH82_01980 [Planctomycetota bacterium]|nr:MAG: hypothetical protein DWH82_01980 [Planctomycetota bacterium]
MGALNAPIFENYITKIRAREIRSGDLLIMDNLSSHKTAIVRNATEENGIDYQYLPPTALILAPSKMRSRKVKKVCGIWRNAYSPFSGEVSEPA